MNDNDNVINKYLEKEKIINDLTATEAATSTITISNPKRNNYILVTENGNTIFLVNKTYDEMVLEIKKVNKAVEVYIMTMKVTPRTELDFNYTV